MLTTNRGAKLLASKILRLTSFKRVCTVISKTRVIRCRLPDNGPGSDGADDHRPTRHWLLARRLVLSAA